MSEHNITVEGGTSVRLKTAGKYCDRDIVVTATGSDAPVEDLDAVLTEQEELIATLKETLRGKASGGGSAVAETITIAQDCGNAQEVYDLFASCVPDGVVSAMFDWIGDTATAANNQFIFGALLFANGLNENTSTRMLYVRYRDGNFGSLVSSGSAYDLVLKTGDKVRMTASRGENL